MPLICSNCFVNEGIKAEAERLGVREGTTCLNCSAKDGVKLSLSEINKLYEKYFVHGSVPQNIGGYAPILNISIDKKMEDLKFASSLNHDYKLLKKVCNKVLFHYGPPLWRLGLTEHYEAIESGGKKRTQALKDIIDQAQILVLPKGSKLFRVRINVDPTSITACDFDTPPIKYRKNYYRFDSHKIPLFYSSFDVETCLHECRVTVSDEISLATFRTKKKLKILNLIDSFAKEMQGTPFDSVEILLNKLCCSAEDEYWKCRLISKEIQKKRFDGFKYKSYFSLVKPRILVNVALFGYPVKTGKIVLESINRVKLERVNYEYSFGPSEGDYEM